jgi:hypothetical protein
MLILYISIEQRVHSEDRKNEGIVEREQRMYTEQRSSETGRAGGKEMKSAGSTGSESKQWKR